MKRVVIEISEEMHRKLKIYCFNQGISVKKYVTQCVIRDPKQKKEQTPTD